MDDNYANLSSWMFVKTSIVAELGEIPCWKLMDLFFSPGNGTLCRLLLMLFTFPCSGRFRAKWWNTREAILHVQIAEKDLGQEEQKTGIWQWIRNRLNSLDCYFIWKGNLDYGRAGVLSLGYLRCEETVPCVMPSPSFRGFFFFLEATYGIYRFFHRQESYAHVSGLKCKHRRNSIFRLILLFFIFIKNFGGRDIVHTMHAP